MHRLPSKRSIHRLRLAAVLYIGKCLMAPVAVCLLLYCYVSSDPLAAKAGVGVLAVTALVVLAQWVIAARASCPLCFAPVLGCKECAKHRKARPLLGSHRLRVSADILLNNSFRCPYCGEPSVLEVRQKRRNRQPRGVDRPPGMG